MWISELTHFQEMLVKRHSVFTFEIYYSHTCSQNPEVHPLPNSLSERASLTLICIPVEKVKLNCSKWDNFPIFSWPLATGNTENVLCNTTTHNETQCIISPCCTCGHAAALFMEALVGKYIFTSNVRAHQLLKWSMTFLLYKIFLNATIMIVNTRLLKFQHSFSTKKN